MKPLLCLKVPFPVPCTELQDFISAMSLKFTLLQKKNNK
jgi:hypothetical protein